MHLHIGNVFARIMFIWESLLFIAANSKTLAELNFQKKITFRTLKSRAALAIMFNINDFYKPRSALNGRTTKADAPLNRRLALQGIALWRSDPPSPGAGPKLHSSLWYCGASLNRRVALPWIALWRSESSPASLSIKYCGFRWSSIFFSFPRHFGSFEQGTKKRAYGPLGRAAIFNWI